MEVRIITQADDVIVHLLVTHLVVEIEQDVDFGDALGVQDNLGFGTHLTASTPSSLEQIGKTAPVGFIADVALLEL